MSWPESIVDHQASGVLEIAWNDGRRDHLPHGLLRSRCRCAGCEQRTRELGALPELSTTVRLASINPIGDVGLNLVFDDGHGRGIFPWAYLRDLGDLPAAAA